MFGMPTAWVPPRNRQNQQKFRGDTVHYLAGANAPGAKAPSIFTSQSTSSAVGFAAAAALAGSLICGAALGQVAPATSSSPELQEIVVTGSLIKRTDTETPAPVQVLSSEDIKNMGYTNVSEALANLSANGQGTLSQGFSFAFASGGSGIALRGLTVGDTLTLIDGQRMVSYPISDDNQRSFVDVSAIPINVVDRIEVLKDGASATYGADAIAGVVNIILKKSYIGSDFTAEVGTSQKHDGTTEHLAGIYGIGDLDSDGYNAYIAVDYHHQDQILASSRHDSDTDLNFDSGTLAAYGGLNDIPGAYGNPFVAYPGSTTGYLINPTTGATGAFLPGCSAAAQQLQQCTYWEKGWQLLPSTGQTNILSKLTKTLGPNFTSSLTVSLFNSKAEQVGNYNTTDFQDGGVQALGVAPGQLPFVNSYAPYTVPANYPGNPYGTAAALIYNFPEIGNTKTLTDTNTYRAIWDLKGTVAGVDIAGSLGAMYSRMELKELGVLEAGLVQPALNNGYVVGVNADPNAAYALAPELLAHPTSTLYTADLHASKSLFDFPWESGGPFAVAAGVQFFRKVLDDIPPSQVSDGVVEGGNPAYALGSQNDVAAFTEFNAMPIKMVEIDGAVRYDNYNNGVGGSITPEAKFKFKPVDMFAIRGTWGRGFRAPSIAESGESGSFFGAGTTYDPILCPNPSNPNAKGNFPSQCQFFLTGYQQPGTNLKPVKSLSQTLGFIFEPSPVFSVSADYFHIKLTNDIISLLEAGGISDYTQLVRGATASLPYCTANNVCTTNVTTPVGLTAFGTFPYVNAGETLEEGFDIDLQSHIDLNGYGKLSAELNYTHIIEYDVTYDGNTYILAGTHGPSGISGDTGNPKDRAVFTLTYTNGPLTISGTENYTSHFTITDSSAGVDTCAEGLGYDGHFNISGNSVPGYACTVGSWVETNLYAQWAVSSQLAVHGAVTNVFNRQAPLDYATYGGFGTVGPYDPSLHEDGVIGRFLMVGAEYKFK
jgi:iron complex outermembrane receptor protein